MVGPFGLRPKATMRSRALPLGQALVRRGHTVHLLLPPWSAPEDAGRAWDEGGVRVEHVWLPPRLPGLYQAMLTARLYRRALALGPDVIHYFKPKAYPAFVAQLARARRRLGGGRTALVLDSDDWEGPGGWNDVEPYGAWARRLFAFQERWELRRADAVTVASRALETLAWAAGARRERVFYLPNGCLPPAAEGHGERVRARHGLGRSPLLLLYTRFAEFTLAGLAEILRQVAQARPDVRLLVVGQGLRGEEKRLPELLAPLGLAGAVSYAGWVEPGELGDYFAAAQVALHPYDDTLINRTKCSAKLGELLAHGVPVVASAVGENCHYVEHGLSGLLVPAGEPGVFAQAVLALLADPDLARRLGRAAAGRMRERFDWDRLAERAEAAYRSAVRVERGDQGQYRSN